MNVIVYAKMRSKVPLGVEGHEPCQSALLPDVGETARPGFGREIFTTQTPHRGLGARGGEESSEDDEVKWEDINWEAAWRQEGAQTKLKKRRRRTHHGFPAPCLEMC